MIFSYIQPTKVETADCSNVTGCFVFQLDNIFTVKIKMTIISLSNVSNQTFHWISEIEFVALCEIF